MRYSDVLDLREVNVLQLRASSGAGAGSESGAGWHVGRPRAERGRRGENERAIDSDSAAWHVD
jgi:hypothetical protein